MKSRIYLLWPAVFVLLVAAGAGAAAIVSAGGFGVAWSVALGDATATGSSAGYGTGSGSTVATGSTSSFGVALGVGANGGSGTGSGTGVAGFTDGTAYAGGVAEASASGGGGFGFSVGLGGAIATTGSNPNNLYTYQSNTDGEQVKATYSTTRGATSFVASEKTADYGSNVIYQDKANGSSTVRVDYRSTSPTGGVAQYQVVYQEAKNGVVTYRVTYRADDGSLYTYTYLDNPSDSKPAYVKEQTRGNIDASSLSLAGGFAAGFGSGSTGATAVGVANSTGTSGSTASGAGYSAGSQGDRGEGYDTGSRGSGGGGFGGEWAGRKQQRGSADHNPQPEQAGHAGMPTREPRRDR